MAQGSQQKPQDSVAHHCNRLITMIRNFLIDNKNFKSDDGQLAHYFKEYPMTHDFVHHVLKGIAEHLVEEATDLKTFCIDMATFDDSTLKDASDTDLITELLSRGYASPDRQKEAVK